MREVGEQLLAWRAAGERLAIATVVRVEGSAPRPVGATLLAASGARIAGSVSNGCVEADLYEQCLATLTSDRARLVRYGISDELAFTVGLSCGGSIDVLVEPVGRPHERVAAALSAGEPALLARVIEPAERAGTVGVWIGERPDDGWDPDLALAARAALGEGDSRIVATRLADGTDASVFLEALPVPARLVIVGATDIAMALARFAKGVGYRVLVADPRTALATRERFPDAAELVHLWPDEALARVALDESAAVVVLSHDPKFDHPALVAALRSRAGYVGAIGSRRTNEQRFAWLREQGFAEEDLARVHAPIGLDLGARTAEEIALAIAAEIVAARRGRSAGSLRAPPLAAARSR
jgi:xanthine dehydrogenase accessory factor